jgi:hypothetical protein
VEDAQGCLDNYIDLAENQGDILPLREILSDLLPTLAKTPVQARGLKYIAEHFVHLPPHRGRGQRYRKLGDPVACAISDAARIRALWRQQYGRRNRPSHLVSAEAIAAERHDVTVEQINNRLKHRAKS